MAEEHTFASTAKNKSKTMKDIVVVILAAGKGKRIGAEEAGLPKVMFKVAGKPMVWYSVEKFRNLGIKDVILVIGYQKEKVMGYFADDVKYAVQEELLGTGHAAMMARDLAEGKYRGLLVCYGDNPMFAPKSIKKVINTFKKESPTIAMLTVKFKDPEYWAFGRIVRNKREEIVKIVEQKDCSLKELKIQESNPGFYIFNNDWFWANIDKLRSDNSQKEYYLTDMIGLAVEQGKKVIGIPVKSEQEALGINNLDQLKEAEKILKEK